ncbi:unnamed protein product [Angiostrongylus costaricensis]|uniref:ZP domain-containing protein n=1 Tax=Angiostrongylus costaricensis TaxID=334426 RepID=A0A3P7JCM7_ANGCS|nr:unnamed protein product [Angiostrongylus costaricensis]
MPGNAPNQLSIYVAQSLPITIDNDIVGEPDIECLEEEIRIWVKTRKPFAGRIYAKGKADVEECSKDDFAKERTKKPHFDLQFGVCGMKSLRSVDPRGMYYGVTIVVSFHPLFITKVDQAFHVKCFFEEASHGLTAELGVSMIPTTEVNARHGIPGCSYSIHKSSIDDLDQGKPAGPPIQFARIGDRVLHQWHCNDKMFGVLINNCYVTDGFGKKADVVNDKGCPVDPILITGIRYSTDLQRAYAESSVFKFADKPGVWFFCQIQMCMKKSGMCNGITVRISVCLKVTKDSETIDAYPPACATTAPPIEEREDGYPLSSGPPYPPSVPPLDELAYPEPTIPQPKATTSSNDYFENRRHSEYLEYPEENKRRKLHKSVSDFRDYNDYDDVTIPPNLSDLLANLPDDVSAETLQKMFRSITDGGGRIVEETAKGSLTLFNLCSGKFSSKILLPYTKQPTFSSC